MARQHVGPFRCSHRLQAMLCAAALLAVFAPLATGTSSAHAATAASPDARQAFALEPFAEAPFKRAPFKRAPFKRAPFKRAPFKRADVPDPFRAQLVPTSVARAGALRSATAAIDGVDEPLDVDVAVLDGGVDADHPDLRVAGSFDCTGTGAPREDRDGHGTMVAGLLAARDDGLGVVGMAPGARIWSVRVARPDGTVTESAARCGLAWLVDNAATIDVANLSWSGAGSSSSDCGAAADQDATRQRSTRRGGVGVDPGAEPDLHALACAAHAAGVTLVAAAGNDAADAAGVLPAAWSEVITVGAIADSDGLPGSLGQSPCDTGERDDHLASFSNSGPVVALAAGGVCVASTDARGGYATGSGTSFAAPIVAGAAALLLVADPDLAPADVRARLLAAAERGAIPGDRAGSGTRIVAAGAT